MPNPDHLTGQYGVEPAIELTNYLSAHKEELNTLLMGGKGLLSALGCCKMSFTKDYMNLPCKWKV